MNPNHTNGSSLLSDGLGEVAVNLPVVTSKSEKVLEPGVPAATQPWAFISPFASEGECGENSAWSPMRTFLGERRGAAWTGVTGKTCVKEVTRVVATLSGALSEKAGVCEAESHREGAGRHAVTG